MAKIIDIRTRRPIEQPVELWGASPEHLPGQPQEHDTCPRCGNLNGPFERLGSGICNRCLDKRVRRHQRDR